MTHFLYVPFTGLGLYDGFRGNTWLRNRIAVFKEYIVPSLEKQTNKNFIIWVSWRPQERNNPQVKELKEYLEQKFSIVFTYGGVCFWDDKYEDSTAWNRLINSLHVSLNDLLPYIDNDWVLMTIQPSDDFYNENMIEEVQEAFKKDDALQAIGYKHGWIANYITGELAEYNPVTNPPFFTIKFPKDKFISPLEHVKYTGPYKSHEYVGDFLVYKQLQNRGFTVGTHQNNISTNFNIPYKGNVVGNIRSIKLRTSLGRRIMSRLPHKIRRKIRYYNEIFYKTKRKILG